MISAVLLVIAVICERTFELSIWQLLVIYSMPYLIVGYDIIGEALEGVIHGEAFNEDFLMTVATLGALFIGFLPGAETQFPEAVFVMLFFQVGELFEDYAEDKSRDSIAKLMDIRPDTAHVMRGEVVKTVHPDSVQIDDTVIVKPGEKIPLDGVILEGDSSLNTVALTGESVPRDVQKGDEVLSGCINLTGLLQVRVTKSFGNSTASKIIDLVENASENKSKSETFISKFAKIYTPIVVFSALLLAFIPPLLLGSFTQSFPVWLNRALTFLVVSCPCALVISVPLTFFGGIGGASRKGILIKGGNFMETLSKAGIVVFDKTGTLTEGTFEVTAIHPKVHAENHLLHLAAHVERYSTHPIALSLKRAYQDEEDDCRVEYVHEQPGLGIEAEVNGEKVCVGNERMMEEMGIVPDKCHQVGTILHVAINGEYAGHIVISDKVKEESKEAIRALKAEGIEKTVMLTGDKAEIGEKIAHDLGIDQFYAQLLPADKVRIMEELSAECSVHKKLLFVGDGINDAPVLARADVGIAMGVMGSDAALEAADVVLMDDRLSKIAEAIRIGRHTLSIARQNIGFAIFVKLFVLLLATFGLATMWMAVFADVGVTVLAVLNAMRTLRM